MLPSLCIYNTHNYYVYSFLPYYHTLVWLTLRDSHHRFYSNPKKTTSGAVAEARGFAPSKARYESRFLRHLARGVAEARGFAPLGPNPKKTTSGVVAEARGFEPPRRSTRPHDFESCAFNHSATLPFIILSQKPRKCHTNLKNML